MKISQKIIDYAIWYYLKYYPSVQKLREKLFLKFGENSLKGKLYGGISKDEIDYIIEQKLKNIIQEEEVIQSKIRVYKDKGKSKLYIRQKLYERKEKKELIDQLLEEHFLEGEDKNLLKEYEKLKNKYKLGIGKIKTEYDIKNKIIKHLLRKGFNYDDIIFLFKNK